MQRLKVLGLALMAVFMLGVVASSSASAETLPKFSVETGGTGKLGKSKLNNIGAAIVWPKGLISKFSTTKGTEGRLGTFDILFEEATLVGEPCLSLGDALGTILLTGEWHLVHLPKAPKHVSLLLLINETHVECPGLGILILFLAKSTLLALILPFGTLTKSFTLTVTTKEAGKVQDNTEWVDDAGVTHTTELLVTLNSAKGDKKATVEIQEITLTTEKETEVQEK